MLKKIKKIKIELKYKKDNGLYVIDIDKIKAPFIVKERTLVVLPPGQFGGNHSHPRQEAFVAIGKDLELIWLNGKKKNKIRMDETGKHFLFVVPANLPHAVINRSKDQFGILVELADGIMKEVAKHKIISEKYEKK